MWACFSLSAGGGGCAGQEGGGERLVVREAVRGQWEKGRAGARVKECQ